MATLLSIQTGKPKRYGAPHSVDPYDRAWRSAIFKVPVRGEVYLGNEGLEGDAVADLRFHGGPDNAVLCYAAEHYPKWQEEWGASEPLPFGGFGENLTLSELDEISVCVGDIFRVGDAVVQVSGPRKPCYKLERRWRRNDLIRRVKETGRGGWYARVLQSGTLRAGEAIALLERQHPEWTMTRVCDVSYARQSREEVWALISVPALATRWRDWLQQKAEAVEK